MKIKITVTKEILRESMMCGTQGKSSNSYIQTNCPIALAVREIFPKAIVGPFALFISGNFGENNKVLLPVEASRFIKIFDRLKRTPNVRLNLPELEFDVILSDGAISALPINIDEAIKIINGSKTLELA